MDKLLADPFGSRVSAHVEVKHLPPIMTQNKEDIENAECNRRYSKEIDGDEFLAMVFQKRSPHLRGWFGLSHHVFGNGRLEIEIPSLSSSPWIRGAPQSGFSLLIFRINSRISLEVFGLPAQRRMLFQVQNRRKPLRCHAITISGLTMTRAERQLGQICESQTHSTLSQVRSLGLLGTERRRTLIWWRRATISIWSSRRVRKLKMMEESKGIKMLNMNREAINSIL